MKGFFSSDYISMLLLKRKENSGAVFSERRKYVVGEWHANHATIYDTAISSINDGLCAALLYYAITTGADVNIHISVVHYLPQCLRELFIA